MQTKITNLSSLHTERPRVGLDTIRLQSRHLGVCVVVEAVNEGEPRWLVVTPYGGVSGTSTRPMSNIDACELALQFGERLHPGAEYFVEMHDVVGGLA
jgi:hypothetical protein